MNYFDIPAFMMISGFLYKRVPIKHELKKSFRGIVIPYLLFNFILLIISLFFYSFQWMDIIDIFTGNQEGLRWICFYPMWFLISILAIRIISSLCKEEWYLWMMLGFFIVGFFVGKIAPYELDYFQLCTTIMCYPFFLMGTILKKYNAFELPNKIKPIIRYLLILPILCMLVYLMKFNGFANIFRCISGDNTLLYYLIGISFSYLILYIFSKLFTKESTMILTISSGTVLILGLHRMFLLGIIHNIPKNNFTAITVSIIVMIICYPLIVLAKKYFPALLGGRGVEKQKSK